MRKYMEEILNAWESGKSLSRPSASTDGRNIFSYGTMILQGAGDNGEPMIFNATKYSSTTSNQQSAIVLYFYRKGINFNLLPEQVVTGVRRGAQDLSSYLPQEVKA